MDKDMSNRKIVGTQLIPTLTKLAQDNIVLSENLIKLAIANETENEVDEYEYDPVIGFAINHLRAIEVLDLVRSEGWVML